MPERKAYSQAFNTGRYEKVTGLFGKYDNVRRLWEDQITSIFLRPHLNNLVDYKKKRLERLRILDLGCGAADGYDLIMGVTTKDPGIYEYVTAAITDDMLKRYVGVDVNEDLLRQAREYLGDNSKTEFIQADLTQGLPPEILRDQAPFDFYFSSYGTLSHFHHDECVKIFCDICEHTSEYALVMADWLGRYSYEWQDLWHEPADREVFMDYRISYIFPEEERGEANITSFPLRLMSRDEVMSIINEASRICGVDIKPLAFFDRSLFVGRHLETGDYNRHPLKHRSTVNSLFEHYVRTDLERLLTDYQPRPGFDHLNTFFESFFMCCNTLVTYTISLLSGYDAQSGEFSETPEIQPYYPPPLKEAMHSMKRVIKGVGWLEWGDVRANVIEPHLGFSLRKMEMDLQTGSGFGHGLVGIFEIRK